MPGQLRDWYVTFHREEYIAELARDWRRANGGASLTEFNVVQFVEQTLVSRLSSNKGGLSIKLFDMSDEQQDPAYVTIEPLTLHVDHEIWRFGKLGDPFARHVLAHEAGHIILHGQYPKAAFSSGPEARLKAFPKENSAEWQAETFAEYLLLPTRIIGSFACPRDVARACSVPTEMAEKRFTQVREEEIRRRLSREYCPTCGQIDCLQSHLPKQQR
jgi:hypothetical protein